MKELIKKLQLIKPYTPDEYEFIDKTISMLQTMNQENDDKFLKYYEKIIKQMEPSQVVTDVLRIVYQAISSKSSKKAIEYINTYEFDLSKDIEELKSLTIRFIQAFTACPKNYKGYKKHYFKQIDPIINNAKKSDPPIYGIMERMFVVTLLENAYDAMRPHESLINLN